MKLKQYVTTLFLIILTQKMIFAQVNRYSALHIGDNIEGLPDFENVINNRGKRLSLEQLRGKLIIIDFWSTGCPSCIAAIPHLEQLQKDFDGRIQIILVDPWETKNNIELRISKMRILRPGIGLTTLPNVYGDSKWRLIFPHTSLPHHIWIDKEGKVIASTGSVNATRLHIQDILDGKKLNLSIKKDLASIGYNVRERGLMQVGDSSLHPLFYSSIIKANHGFGAGSQIILDSINNVYKLEIYNESILSLFQRACRGYHVSLEVKDSSKFYRPVDSNKYDQWFEENCFCYELVIPLKDRDSLNYFMINDLNRFFSSSRKIEAVRVKKIYPTYVLKRAEEKMAQFLLQSDKPNSVLKKLKKQPILNFKILRETLKNNLEDFSLQSPLAFADETKIKDETKIVINIPTDFTDKKALRKVLFDQGFSLLVENREMFEYVLRDVPK